MTNRRQQTGRRGEELAAAHLRHKGYTLLERNWRCPTGEVDIIAQDQETLVFVEVRTRRGRRFGPAEASITPAKQTRLIDLAHSYLKTIDTPEPAWRIDVIAVQLAAGSPRINHIENAVGW